MDTYPHILEQVRGWGLINGLVLKADAPLKSLDIVKSATAQGLLLVPAGPNVVRFVPPLIVNASDINIALDKLATAIKQIA